MKPSISLFVLAATLAAPTGVYARSDDSDGAPDKSDDEAKTEIIVSATRTRLPASALPLTVDVIDSEELNRQIAISGSTVDAVSALLPSFSPTREKLSGSGESLRGRSPLYAINGIPQSTPVRDGSRDGYTIDSFFIDRVEVIYGSNALQGIGGTGGVVNQVTVSAPSEDGVSVESLLQVTAADGFDGAALSGKIGAVLGYRAGDFDMNLGATFARRGVFLDGHGNAIGVDTTQGEIQDSDSWSVFGRVGYQLSPTARIEIIANRFELEGNNNYVPVPGDRVTGIPASSTRGVTPGVTATNQANLLSLSFTEEDLGGGTFEAKAFYSRTQAVFGGGIFTTFQDPTIDPTGNLFDQSANRSRKLGAKFSYERAVPGLDDLVVTVGFDALIDRTKQFLVQTGRSWVPQTDFRSLAPFAQTNLALFDGVARFVGGLRYENVRLKVDDYQTLASYGATDRSDLSTYKPVQVAGGKPSFNKLLPNAGVIVEPVDGVRAYASYAEGYTIADVGRILRGVTDANVDIDSFVDLEPVISDNREIGLEVERGIFTGSATYFWSSSDFGSRLALGPDGIYDVVRQPIDIQGFEANAAIRVPPVPGLSLSAAYADIEGQTDDDNDGLVDEDLDGANISPDRLNLAATYENGRWNARLAARFYLSRGFAGQPPAADFEGYGLLDAYIGYSSDIGEFALAVQNLTDAYYITYNSDTVRITDDDRFFAGRGRTITLSWRGAF